jgi:RHS repeat-associated protein
MENYMRRCISLLLLVSVAAVAQLPPVPPSDRGIVPGRMFDANDIETISIESGNLLLKLPLASLPAGPGGSGFSLGMTYNSQIFDEMAGSPELIVPSTTGGGWHYSFQYALRLDEAHANPSDPTPCDQIHGLSVIFPDGSQHALYLNSPNLPDNGVNFTNVDPTTGQNGGTLFNGACINITTYPSPLVYYTADSTYSRLEVTTTGSGVGNWVLYLPDGRRAFGAGVRGGSQLNSISDRNGNTITFTYSNNANNYPQVIMSDELGRQIVLLFSPTFSTLPHNSQFTNPGPIDIIDAPGANGQRLLTSVNWSSPANLSYSLTYFDFGCPPTNTCVLVPGVRGVGSIVLPSPPGTLQYSFDYNSNNTDKGWGELKSMTLPYGSQVQYGYHHGGASDLGLSTDSYAKTENPIVSKTLTYTDSDSSSTVRHETTCYTVWGATTDTCAGTGTLAAGTKLVLNPDGGIRKYLQNTTNDPRVHQIIQVTEPNGDVIDRTWRTTCPGDNAPYNPVGGLINQFVKAEFRTVKSSLGDKISSQFYSYDRNGNLLSQSVYDFVPSFTFTRESSGSPVPNPPSGATLIRSIGNTYWNGVGASGDPPVCSADTLGYWHALESSAGAAAKLDSRKSTETSDGSGMQSRVEYSYDSPTSTGNLTSERSWDSTMSGYSNPLSASNSIVVTHTYDVSGNQITTTNANNVLTSSTFDQCASSNGLRFAYPSSVATAGLTTSSNITWDCQSGLQISSKDSNSVKTVQGYDDRGRPTMICEAAEAITLQGAQYVCQWTDASGGRQTKMSYVESSSSGLPYIVNTSKDLYTRGDLVYFSSQKFGQLGQIAVSNPGDTTTQHLGPTVSGGFTYSATSNPQFQAGGDGTAGWTRTTADTMGRVTKVEYYSGQNPPLPWGATSTPTASSSTNYDGYSSTISDESNNKKQQLVDAAGRLKTVIEDPTAGHQGSVPALNYSTNYTYDFNDNLKIVDQSGLSLRTFSYSSLGRLISTSNPESGTVNYTYDQNGNLLTKVDARLTKTTYAFDNLNRLRSKTYSGGSASPTLTSTYCYGDDASNQTVTRGAGSNAISVSWACSGAPSGSSNYLMQRLTQVSGDQSLTQYTQYDAHGNLKASQQTTNSVPYSFPSYSYNAYGMMTSMMLPSGRTLTWTYDSSARPTGVTGIFGGSSTNYASVPTTGFWPFGAVKTLNLAGATNFTQSSGYDTRLRPTSLNVSAPSATETLGYTWTVNGNLQQQTISNSINAGALTQSFTYDSVNRLTSMTESGGSNEPNQYFGYDNTGNRSLLSPPSNFIPYAGVTPQVAQPTSNWVLGQTLPVAYAPFASNRYNVAHDAAGNETAASTVTSTSSTAYDAENRLQTVTGLSMGVLRYYYDGDGRRVMKVLCATSPCTNTSSGAQITTFVYDSTGQLAAQYAPAAPVNGTQYLFADHLGSTRMMLTSAGAATRCYDYAPFGEELIATVGSRANCYSDVNYPSATPEALTTKFTSQERDAETGIDWFSSRYFSAAQGRFTSPDEPLADQHPDDPQSWNLYSYARNNSLRFSDPSGRACVYIGKQGGDLNDPTNYATIGTEQGTCADAFSNDVPLNQSIQQMFTQVVKNAEGPVNLAAKGLEIFFAIFGIQGVHETAPEPVSGISQGRTPQDVRSGGRTVPEPRTSGKIGTSRAQEAQVNEDIAEAQSKGAADIRKNQIQVNSQGQVVGVNRPDLQYTLNGRRYYIEYERSADFGRGFAHAERIKANDPSAIIQVKIIP